MGKKGSWFSAIKKVFSSSSSKEKQPHSGQEKKKNAKEKKKNRGILKHGDNKSFIPLFREPSSIEKILGEVDQQKLFARPAAVSSDLSITQQQQVASLSGQTSPRVTSPRGLSPRAVSPKVASPRASSQRVASPRVAPPPHPRVPSPRVAASPAIAQNRREVNYVSRPEPTLRNQHLLATKIQAAFRGYMARRSFRALRGLVRLQGVLKSQNVKRQTVSAMKQMQLLVRVQNQIQSRRIQMLENQALHRQSQGNDKDVESTLSKWTLNQMSEVAGTEDWDDSLLTKEEVEERLRKKVEAVIKRERAMAYAYSHQLWKANPKSALDFRSNGFPWWWNWLERQLPAAAAAAAEAEAEAATPSENQSTSKHIQLTPSRPVSDHKPSPSSRLQATNYYNNRHQTFTNDHNHESTTPKSSKSAITFRAKQFHSSSTLLRTPTRTHTTPTPPQINYTHSSSGLMKYTRARASTTHSPFDTTPLNDTDSLTSCPPFSVPNYMTPTVSAKAKVRASSNPKERIVVPGTPSSAAAGAGGRNDSKRRFSFPLTPNIGSSFKWNKGGGGSNKYNGSSHNINNKVLEKNESMRSIGEVSLDSAVSMPAIVVGRKPFNRFV